ncbi:MAG: ImmA/IrrE family metallo-endopeptidase [Homoserinimonas sp.]
MTVRVPVSPDVLLWALDRSADPDAIATAFPSVERWVSGDSEPTVKQLHDFASRTGTAYGYFFLSTPPALEIPIKDFREGFGGQRYRNPSVNLLAVLHQSLRRQEWYRDYAIENGFAEVAVVGRGVEMSVAEAAADMRAALNYEIQQRVGSWDDQRKRLLAEFEALGGLTVVTSMVENNTHRLLDDEEFRGFSLVDDMAPLVFVNARQTINGQLFTLAHEFAHVWKGVGGVSDESLRVDPQGEIERWCNNVASEFLVPPPDLRQRYGAVASLKLTDQLERLAAAYRCGTLVVLQALRRTGLRDFEDYEAEYDAEVARLKALSKKNDGPGGQFIYNQPFRIGTRLSRALISDAMAGRTRFTDAARLMSFKSMKNFDSYASYLGMVRG